VFSVTLGDECPSARWTVTTSQFSLISPEA
jgi:hypothetical protein